MPEIQPVRPELVEGLYIALGRGQGLDRLSPNGSGYPD